MRVGWSGRTGLAVLVGVAGLALGGCGTPTPGSPPGHRAAADAALRRAAGSRGCAGPTVTATGSGTVGVAPDALGITLDVHTRAASATAALDDNNARARALIATLGKAGVAGSDIQTTGLSIEPTFSRPKGKPATVSGYQVDDTVTAQVHELSSAGRLVDRAVAQLGGAVRLEGISFSLHNTGAAEAAAHTRAVRAAVGQARSMAVAAGSGLGSLCSVSDVANGDALASGSASAAAGPAGGVPIQAGSQQVGAEVRVVYALAG